MSCPSTTVAFHLKNYSITFRLILNFIINVFDTLMWFTSFRKRKAFIYIEPMWWQFQFHIYLSNRCTFCLGLFPVILWKEQPKISSNLVDCKSLKSLLTWLAYKHAYKKLVKLKTGCNKLSNLKLANCCYLAYLMNIEIFLSFCSINFPSSQTTE